MEYCHEYFERLTLHFFYDVIGNASTLINMYFYSNIANEI